ncbi:MAG TPA: hypothetical protein VNW29_01140 [Candidatus Sulfotelmatobacter sp.]|jgi:hypothetical protein|nr:hypothetical protein [Candidatus Sulfotelmatobacter sp.]
MNIFYKQKKILPHFFNIFFLSITLLLIFICKLFISQVHAASPSPTYYCIVGTKNNCVPTTQPTAAITNTIPVGAINGSSSNAPSVQPSPSPIISGAPTQMPCSIPSRINKNGKGHLHTNGYLSKLFAIILQFIEGLIQLLEQLLGITPASNTPCVTGTTGNPSPSSAPSPSTIPSVSQNPAAVISGISPTTVTTNTPTQKPTKAPNVPVPTKSSTQTKIPTANTSTCSGKYKLTNPRKMNFGDPSCNFTKNDLYTLLKQQDPANASRWFNTVVPCESGYNPNAYASPATGTPDKGGAWGLFQMGQGKNGKYDHGDVDWHLQSSNSVTYNKSVINGNWRYWACARAFWK